MIRRMLQVLRSFLIAVGNVLAIVNTFIILTLVYVLIIGPIKLVFLVLRYDPLSRNLRTGGTFWRKKEHQLEDKESFRRQF
jgi:hypothetical protein